MIENSRGKRSIYTLWSQTDSQARIHGGRRNNTDDVVRDDVINGQQACETEKNSTCERTMRSLTIFGGRKTETLATRDDVVKR